VILFNELINIITVNLISCDALPPPMSLRFRENCSSFPWRTHAALDQTVLTSTPYSPRMTFTW